MKILIVPLVLLLSLPAQAADCPRNQPKTEAALLQLEQNWAQALSRHDADALACLLADEFEDADPDGQLSDRTTALAKAAKPRPVHHELTQMHAHVYGDMGYVRGLAKALDSQSKIVATVRFTDLYAYRDGRWQCVAGHESLVSAVSH